jgi:S-DNA-T family DNA segregation ATPase FtsK/SpoIIIE
MAKRKRSRKNRATDIFEIDESIAEEIWGLAYLGLGVITILSINGNFGILGNIWLEFISPILGWGIYIIPVIFISIALIFFTSRKISFSLGRTFGIMFLMTSILGIFHLYVPTEEMHELARNGQYGGYIGFVSNFILRSMFNIGHLGAGVIFFLGFMISSLLTFEISLSSIAKTAGALIQISKKSARKVKATNAEEYEEDEIPIEEEEEIQFAEDELATISKAPQKIEIKRSSLSKVTDATIVAPIEKTKSPQYSDWEYPSLDLLNEGNSKIEIDDKQLKKNAEMIKNKLSQFGIEVIMHEINVGPTVIQYTLKPEEGVKLSKIVSFKDDLALALAAESVRIEAPIPGKSLVGIEVPNSHRVPVFLREILESKDFQKTNSRLRLPLGRDVSGSAVVADLSSMPHLLIAGATGAGKSVGMNGFIISLLYQNSPEHLKMIMIDPKRVELASFNSIPHLLTPVITDPEKASLALKWAVAEMNRRYQLCAEAKHRNITDYNADRKIEDKMCNIVIIIDELADLMMTASKDVETSICRLAQMARAVGIHLIIATQRPSVNVLTGLIKANIPARIAFAVSSSIDSRTILDCGGAEDLLGKGDMLYLGSGTSKLTRIQGILISPKEIEKITNRVKLLSQPDYDDSILNGGQRSMEFGEEESYEDELYMPALEVIRADRKASASLLQRRLKIGYARAARLLDLLEESGKIGPVNGAKAREIYVE